MSSFEFILVSIAIVVGLGISEVLADWGRLLRHRHEARPYPLQIVASAFVLALSLRFLWTLWTLRGIEWTYLGYLLVFAPGLALALMAHLTRVELESLRRTPREQYFANRVPLFVMLASFPICGAASSWYHAEYLRASLGSTTGPFRFIWPVMIGTSLWLAHSASPRHHWIGWALIWLTNLAVSALVLPSLGPS